MATEDLCVKLMGDLVPVVFPGATLRGNILPLRGGLEGAVARLTIDGDGRSRRHVVVKRLTEAAQREAGRYGVVASAGVAAALLGSIEHGGATYLFLEHIRSSSNWPWGDGRNTRLVLEGLASIHRLEVDRQQLHGWNYEEELRASAAETVMVAAECAPHLPELQFRRNLRPLRRVAASVERVRGRVMDALGTTLIHGDVHTGNVIIRTVAGRREIVFLDWGRSRIGSALEDVSSWLLSLGSWEPAAAREHDTLLCTYLAAVGLPAAFTNELRDAYWMAAARNVLAGALRYHLLVARESDGHRRDSAITQAKAALRIIRRTDERLPA